MAEDNQNMGDSGAAGSTAGIVGGDIAVDKNKSAEQYMDEAQSKYIVPRLVREKSPDLVKLIFETESMNVEEREYWMQIMPIMSEEQIAKFREILVTEKQQLEQLDQEYEGEINKINTQHASQLDEVKMKERMQQIAQEESASEKSESEEEELLLKKLQEF